MTSSSSYKPSAALFLIALLLFSASTQLPVHGLNFFPDNVVPLFCNLLSNLGGGNLLPQINIIGLIIRILTSILPVTLNVVGQVTCPGLGPGIGGLPVNLTCLTNGIQLLGGQTVTNRNGSFAVNATVSPLQAIALVSNLLPNNTLACLVSTRRQLVQSVVSCPALTNTTNGLVSLVQFTRSGVFSLLTRVLSASATGSIAA